MPDRAVLITDAEMSADEELARRQRRYLFAMLIRIPMMIAGGVLASLHLVALAIVVVVLSIPLPWVAVLLANEGPAKNAKPLRKVLPGTISYDRAIERPHSVVDADDHSA